MNKLVILGIAIISFAVGSISSYFILKHKSSELVAQSSFLQLVNQSILTRSEKVETKSAFNDKITLRGMDMMDDKLASNFINHYTNYQTILRTRRAPMSTYGFNTNWIWISYKDLLGFTASLKLGKHFLWHKVNGVKVRFGIIDKNDYYDLPQELQTPENQLFFQDRDGMTIPIFQATRDSAGVVVDVRGLSGTYSFDCNCGNPPCTVTTQGCDTENSDPKGKCSVCPYVKPK